MPPPPPSQLDPQIQPDLVSYRLTDVMHATQRALRPFDVLLPLKWTRAAFSLEVTVRVEEVPKPEVLAFVIKTTVVTPEPFASLEHPQGTDPIEVD